MIDRLEQLKERIITVPDTLYRLIKLNVTNMGE